MTDVRSVKDYLSRKSWPAGLQKMLISSLTGISMRYFICDDSGSMSSNDGHRLVESSPTPKFVSYSDEMNTRLTTILDITEHALASVHCRLLVCSRWSEMTESLRFHVGLASAAQSTSEFRLLNGTVRYGMVWYSSATSV